ncbi:MAG TPA: type IV conjugative transfer system protein TraE [Chlamydiales bacterium]|nr:type IV conjugative transfer system protein TraE [Chlamydiales bacterium]
MDSTILQKNINKISRQRNSFILFSIILSVSVLFLSLLLFTKRERIVVIPTNGASFWIEEGKVSSGYIEKMGLFLSDLLLNRSPADVEKRNSIILQHVHPSSYHDIRKLLLLEQASILKSDQSFYFHIHKNFSDVNQSDFVIEGECFAVVGKEGKETSIIQKNKKKYTLRFSCENGRLWLVSVKKEEI